MTSYQNLKFKCEKLQAQVDLFKDALTIARPVDPISIDFTDRHTLTFAEQIAIRRNKIINEKIKSELQHWVAENLDEETISHLLNVKKELQNE